MFLYLIGGVSGLCEISPIILFFAELPMSDLADTITLADVEAAAERISGRVRRTPCLRTRYIRDPLRSGPTMLKLECLQVTGAFKVRGANNAILQLGDAALARGVITASGGNHGLAVAYAGKASGCPAVVYLPQNTPADKAEKIRGWGAEVVVEGADVADRRCDRSRPGDILLCRGKVAHGKRSLRKQNLRMDPAERKRPVDLRHGSLGCRDACLCLCDVAGGVGHFGADRMDGTGCDDVAKRGLRHKKQQGYQHEQQHHKGDYCNQDRTNCGC